MTDCQPEVVCYNKYCNSFGKAIQHSSLNTTLLRNSTLQLTIAQEADEVRMVACP